VRCRFSLDTHEIEDIPGIETTDLAVQLNASFNIVVELHNVCVLIVAPDPDLVLQGERTFLHLQTVYERVFDLVNSLLC
jgi:hypothetical protein